MNNIMRRMNGGRITVGENSFNNVMPPAGGLMPKSLIRIIWHHIWIVLSVTVLVLCATFIYVVKATPIYRSTSRIYVEQSGPKILTEAEGVMTQSKNYLYTQAELLKSTPILSSALEKTGIKQMQIFNSIDNPIAYLKKKGLDISVGRKDDIINVSSNSPNPFEAAQLVNEVVDSYITYHATRKRSTSAEILKILQTEKSKRSKELTEKLTTMMDFKKKHEPLAFESSRGNIVIARLERLSHVLTEAQLATIESKSVYKSIEGMVGDPEKLKQFIEAQRAKGIHVSTGSEKASLRSKLEKLELRLADRLRLVKSGHPAVIALETEIAQIEAQMTNLDAEFARAHLAVAEQQYISSRQKEEQISNYYQEQRKQALDLNEQLAQYTILQSEWEQTMKLCNILDDRIKELNVTEDVGALNISILEVARAADKSSEPNKARFMSIALMMGLMLGGGLALLRDSMDQKLHSTEEISTVLGIPVLGVVPSMSRKNSISERGRKVYLDSNSSSAEAYRTIRTSVFFGAPKGEAKTILITSAAPSDGKTTLASNLAISMAQAGQKVLIIDADFRKPKQHIIFEVNDKNSGLTTVLSGINTLAETIISTKIKGLDLLCRGPDIPNPSETLNSVRFARLLELISSRYDRIIIDSPPVMSVTDAQILAAISDITLLVLRADKSTRKASQQARDGLLTVGASLLGAVVNDVPRHGLSDYYGKYYYGYQSNEKKGQLAKVRRGYGQTG